MQEKIGLKIRMAQFILAVMVITGVLASILSAYIVATWSLK